MVLASVTTFVLKASIVSRNFVTFDAVLEMVLASVTPIHLTIYMFPETLSLSMPISENGIPFRFSCPSEKTEFRSDFLCPSENGIPFRFFVSV